MKRIFLTATLITTVIANALAWGQKGHDVTAYIAEKHLTPATAAAVDSILDGMSMVYWANWLDNASYQADMAYTKTWHYRNIDAGQTWENAPVNPDGDIITGLRQQVELLSSDSPVITDSQRAMKILVHLMGDLHMPLHIGHASDRGGNTIKVKFFESERKLHSLWDTALPDAAHKWSYTEWQEQIDRATPARQEEIIAGTFDDWGRGTMAIAERVYTAMPRGAWVSYNEIARWTPVIEQQFLAGGLRLAHVLNLIFDPSYAATHQQQQ